MRPKTRKSVALNVPNWAPNLTKNAEIGQAEKPVLPKNEAQIRPLLTDLQHDGERLHVWQEVVQAGEKKITAELVQREVDKFKASGQTHQNHSGRAESLRWCTCPCQRQRWRCGPFS